MVVALNLSGVGRGDVAAGVSPLAELMASLHVLAEPDHHPESRTWAAKVMDGVPEGLRADLFRFSPLWARYRTRLFYPLDGRVDRAMEDEIAALAAMDDDRFLSLVANGILGRGAPLRGADEVLSDREWVAYSEHRSFSRGDLAHSLVRDPVRFRGDLIGVLESCIDAFFLADWESNSPRLIATAAALTDRLDQEELLSVVESLSGMASARGSSTTVFFDKLQAASLTVGGEGLLLIPSLRGWPHLMIKTDPGLPVVVHFPIVGDLRPQSQVEIRKRLLVLAEPGRWELCRHLIGESITTTELSIRTGLSAPAVSRHLRVMREAGLISSQRDGRQVFHRVHPSLIIELGRDVLNAIIR
jgi:DNA-binding transcriptional ArsR family regulator